jgi:hypothetical protein
MAELWFDANIWRNVAVHSEFDALISLALTSYTMHMAIKSLSTWTEWKYDIGQLSSFAPARKNILVAGFFEQPLYKQCLVLHNFFHITHPMHVWRYLTQNAPLLDLGCRWVWQLDYEPEITFPYWSQRGALISHTVANPQLDPDGRSVHPDYHTGLIDDDGLMTVRPMPITTFMDDFALLVRSLVLVPVDYSRLPVVDAEFFWDLPDDPVTYLADEQAAKRRKRKKLKQTALIAEWEPAVAEHFIGIEPETIVAQHVVVDLANPLWVPLEKAPGVNLQRVCPISGREITIPARGKDCVHLDCFDLPSFVQHARQTGQWQCPLCTKSLRPPNTIVIDSTRLLEIL